MSDTEWLGTCRRCIHPAGDHVLSGGKGGHKCKLDGCSCHQFLFESDKTAYAEGYEDGKNGLEPETYVAQSLLWRIAYHHGFGNGKKSREGNL